MLPTTTKSRSLQRLSQVPLLLHMRSQLNVTGWTDTRSTSAINAKFLVYMNLLLRSITWIQMTSTWSKCVIAPSTSSPFLASEIPINHTPRTSCSPLTPTHCLMTWPSTRSSISLTMMIADQPSAGLDGLTLVASKLEPLRTLLCWQHHWLISKKAIFTLVVPHQTSWCRCVLTKKKVGVHTSSVWDALLRSRLLMSSTLILWHSKSEIVLLLWFWSLLGHKSNMLALTTLSWAAI